MRESFFLISVIGVIAAVAMIVRWILRPVDRAAKDLQRPTQFTIVDFFSLFFVLQLYMALTHSFVSGSDLALRSVNVIWVFDIYGWISFGMMWALSVQKLSRAGISHTWHRAAFLALVLPVAFFCAIGVPILIVWSIGRFVFEQKRLDSTSLILFGIVTAGTVAIVLAGRFTRWMVAASRPATETASD